MGFKSILLFAACSGGLVYGQQSTRPRLSAVTPTASYISAATYTTANVTLYANSATGSDANPCTASAAPCLTIQGAINKAPKVLRHQLTVNVAAGNYAGFTISGFTSDPSFQRATAGILIDGTLGNVTPATGSATGTATSGTAGSGTTFGTLTDSGATWTTNDFRGKLITITAGTGSGQYAVVCSNTGTVITICGTWTAPTGTSTYAIQAPTSIITSAAAQVPNALGVAGGIAAAGLQVFDNTIHSSSGIVIRGMGLAVGSTSGFTVNGSGSPTAFVRMVSTSAAHLGLFGSRVNWSIGSVINTGSAFSFTNAQTSDEDLNLISTSFLSSTQSSIISNNSSVNVSSSQLTVSASGGAGVSAIGMSSIQATSVRCDCSSGSTTSCLSVGFGNAPTTPDRLSSARVITGLNVVDCTYGIATSSGSTVAFSAAGATFSGNSLAYSAMSSFGGSIILPSAITITSGTADLSVDNGAATSSFATLAATYSCLATLTTGSRVCRL